MYLAGVSSFVRLTPAAYALIKREPSIGVFPDSVIAVLRASAILSSPLIDFPFLSSAGTIVAVIFDD